MQKVRFSFVVVVAFLMLFTTSLSAETMYEKFLRMEAKMQQLESELQSVKKQNEELSQKLSSQSEGMDEEDEEEADEEEEKSVVSAKESDEEATDDDTDEEEDEEEDPAEILADLQESVTELTKATSTNHVKFNIDYRFSVDNLNYKMADGSTKKNDALLANRLWLNMGWAATENLSFKGQLAYYKAFGERAVSNYAPLDEFDWITNENPYDGKIRVKNAYFLYHNNTFLDTPVSWTFSIGRRPSTNGHLINLRDDDPQASPLGHSINVEFDGLSAKFGFEEWVDGMYIKFCLGRGLTNASSRFFVLNPQTNTITAQNPPYANDPKALPDIDLAGFIFQPYSDGQYTFITQYYFATNLIDADINSSYTFKGFETVGNMQSFTAAFMANGIGDGISDFLDDTIFFISGAMSMSDPDKGQDMFHATTDSRFGQSETGYSVWTGVQIPSLLSEEGRWGFEYNWGSRYWRSITYAEDTLIGSKVAARGQAYEAYFTEPLVEDILSLQIRYTYIDYDYTGSNGFFGYVTGASYKISDYMPYGIKNKDIAPTTIKKAQDIRFYIRYRY